MIPWLKGFVTAFLWDEAAAQRWSALGLNFAGQVLTNGGTIPGTGVVIHGLEWAYPAGSYLSLIGLGLLAGTGTKKP